MATHISILAWNVPWTDNLVGYSPWGCKESGTIKQLNMPALLPGIISCFTLRGAVTASQPFIFLAHSQLALSGFPIGDVGHRPA